MIVKTDMFEEMQEEAVKTAVEAIEKNNDYNNIAAYIKLSFDKKYNPPWNCIVGVNFGSSVSHETKRYMYARLAGESFLLLYKSA